MTGFNLLQPIFSGIHRRAVRRLTYHDKEWWLLDWHSIVSRFIVNFRQFNFQNRNFINRLSIRHCLCSLLSTIGCWLFFRTVIFSQGWQEFSRCDTLHTMNCIIFIISFSSNHLKSKANKFRTTVYIFLSYEATYMYIYFLIELMLIQATLFLHFRIYLFPS